MWFNHFKNKDEQAGLVRVFEHILIAFALHLLLGSPFFFSHILTGYINLQDVIPWSFANDLKPNRTKPNQIGRSTGLFGNVNTSGLKAKKTFTNLVLCLMAYNNEWNTTSLLAFGQRASYAGVGYCFLTCDDCVTRQVCDFATLLEGFISYSLSSYL